MSVKLIFSQKGDFNLTSIHNLKSDYESIKSISLCLLKAKICKLLTDLFVKDRSTCFIACISLMNE